jgi:HAD superfamily hydrolase (TIGR01509 family)
MPSTPPNPAVLLDVDGTLVDSAYIHALAWRRAFVEHGFDVPTSSVHAMIGAGSDVLMKELIGEERDDVHQTRKRHFEALKGEIRPFEACADLIRAIHESGAKAILATSSEQEQLETLRRAIDADDAIDGEVSAGDVEDAKPDPDVFVSAMEKAGADTTSAIAVGDTVWDIEAATHAGLKCVCVLTGGIGRLELEEAGAVAVYRDVADLLENLDDSPLAPIVRRAAAA